MSLYELLNADELEIKPLDVYLDTRCPFCGKLHSVAVNEQDYYDWQNGKLAQDAFPYLSADERELIISGICPKCWDSMFGGADKENELEGVLDDYALEFMEHMDDEDEEDEDSDYWDDGCPIEDKED